MDTPTQIADYTIDGMWSVKEFQGEHSGYSELWSYEEDWHAATFRTRDRAIVTAAVTLYNEGHCHGVIDGRCEVQNLIKKAMRL